MPKFTAPFARMVRTTLHLSLVSAVLLTSVLPARADDANDPAAMLRRARATETVDRDVAAALVLYRQVLDAAPGTDAGRDAGLRLLELLEVRGDRTAAIDVARVLTESFGSRLSDETKRLVHESMARMLPAGSRMRSPLGEIYVVPPFGAASAISPLDAKVTALLSRLDEKDSNSRYFVLRDLSLIGADALAPLERILRSERYDHAGLAAEGIARVGTPAAVDTLIRGVREGDGFTRAAALGGLGQITPSENVSPHLVRVVDGLRAEPALADASRRLAATLAIHATDDDLARRTVSTAPGLTDHRDLWAAAAIARGGNAAEQVVRWFMAREEPLPAPVAKSLALHFSARESVGRGPSGHTYRLTKQAEPTVRLDALRLLLRGPPSQNSLGVAEVAVACVHAGHPGVAEEAARLAWLFVTDPSIAGSKIDGALVVPTLVGGGVPVPQEVANDVERVRRLLDGWKGETTGATKPVVASDLLIASPSYHIALARAVRERQDKPWNQLLSHLDVRSVPESAVGAWEEALADLSHGSVWHLFALRVMFYAGRPSALDAVRSAMEVGKLSADWIVGTLFNELTETTQARVIILLLHSKRPQQLQKHSPLGLAIRSALRRPAFYETLAELSRTDPANALRATSRLVEFQYPYAETQAPPSLATHWMAWLRTGETADGVDPRGWTPVAQWAAHGDPAGLAAWLTTRLASRDATSESPTPLSDTEGAALKAICSTAIGPEAREARLALSRRADLAGWTYTVVRSLGRLTPDGDPQRAAELAADPTHVAAADALIALQDLGEWEPVAAIVERLAGRTAPPGRWRETLVEVANHFRLEAALPWLRAEAEGGPPDELERIGATIDLILSHHDRVARLKSFADGSRDSVVDVEAMLDDDDPDLRAAAIVSFAALKGRDALPRLLRLAKAEKDPALRRVLLDTIERVGRAALAPAPPQGDGSPSQQPPAAK